MCVRVYIRALSRATLTFVLFDCLQIGDAVYAKYKGTYYGAFITCVHKMTRTYDVYFPEDPTCPGEQIPHDDIKLPIQTPRQKAFSHWDKYLGMVFFDEGTKKGESPDDPDFFLKAGEWVVDRVTTNNNFICMRLGQPHDDANNMEFDIGYVINRIRKYEEE